MTEPRRAADIELLFDPAPGEWAGLLAKAPAAGERAERFRRELGLPGRAPLVMTGHQAQLWGPGVLAKFFAASALARAAGGAWAWIVPDQDEASHTPVRVPVREAGRALSVAALEIAPATGPGVASASAPAFTPTDAAKTGSFALPSVREGFTRAVQALAKHENAGSAAEQVAGALGDVIEPWCGRSPIVYASRLSGTTLFKSLLERMAGDPAGAARSYNEAVRAHPDAELTLLREGEKGWELPLWRLEAGSGGGRPRARVFSGELAGEFVGEVAGALVGASLAPRALLMTLLVRLAGCELFVHGTGGGLYDRVAEAWARGWLGEPLAPMAVVSATMRLPLAPRRVVRADAARAAWAAHSALHNPGAVGDDALQERKRALVLRVERCKEEGGDPAAHFRELHALLEEHRERRGQELRALADEATLTAQMAEEAHVAQDRAWPFLWHGEAAIDALAREIGSRLGAAITPAPRKR